MQSPQALYFGDFSDPASGWNVQDSSNLSSGYRSGEYEIEIRKAFWWGSSTPALGDISDYSVQVDARLHHGSTGVYGLVFDRVDWDHFYVFVVLPNSQQFAVLRHDPAWVTVIPFGSSTAINAGAAANSLEVKRDDEQMSVYVNEVYLASAKDNSYSGTSGEVGLFAQSFKEIPMAARFDNFLVLPGISGNTASPAVVLPAEAGGEGAGGIGLGQ